MFKAKKKITKLKNENFVTPIFFSRQKPNLLKKKTMCGHIKRNKKKDKVD